MYLLLIKRMPFLSKKGFWVTDKELAIRNSIKKIVQPKYLLRCWNHMTTNITEWLSRHNGKKLDQSFYVEQVKQFLKCSTRDEADNLFEKLSSRWDPVFLDYYNSSFLPEIDQMGRWTLEKLNCYNPFSGITTNQAEGLLFKVLLLIKNFNLLVYL